MFAVKRFFLSLIMVSLAEPLLADTEDKVVKMMEAQVYLLSVMASLDSLALATYAKIYDPAKNDRIIAQVIKKNRGEQSLADFANEIGVSRDQLIASEKTGKGLSRELLEKIWQIGTPLTLKEIYTLQNQEIFDGVSNSEYIVYRATTQRISRTVGLILYLQDLSITKDGVKPTVSQLFDDVKTNYSRLLLFAKENMTQISIDNLIDKKQIDDQLVSDLTTTIDNAVILRQHVGRLFLSDKIKELEANEKATSES